MINHDKVEFMEPLTINDILATICKLKIEINSPYNDGWTVQYYKDQLQKIKKELKE